MLLNEDPIKTRLAPSPTGFLHLGHALHVGILWGIAKRLRAETILRIEDHDRARCRPEFISGIFTDLDWLGFKSNAPAVPKQSERTSRYVDIFEVLRKQDLIYPCDCSRKRLKALPQSHGQSELFYDGHCSMRARGDVKEPFTWRLRVAKDFKFDLKDGICAAAEQIPAQQCGDYVIRDRQGDFSYQFCVVVDDLDQDIDLIIRGEDVLPSTGRQEYLRQCIAPSSQRKIQYYHHRLLLEKDGKEKLAKRRGSLTITQMRAEGCTATSVLGKAAFESGLISQYRELQLEDFQSLFF